MLRRLLQPNRSTVLRRGGSSIPGQEPSDLVAFLTSYISPSDEGRVTQEKVRLFRSLEPTEQYAKVPSIYLDLELYLVELDPCKRFLREQLREIVRTRFPELLHASPDLSLIFQDPSRQEVLLGRAFLGRVCAESRPLLWGADANGCDQLSAWLMRIPEKGLLPSFLGPIDHPRDESDWMQILRSISHRFYDALSHRAGERSARGIYEGVYEHFAEQYVTLDVFPVVLGLIPERLLDRTRTALMRFGAIRRIFLERTEQLHEINEQLLEKNKELAAIRSELHKAKNELEIRVDERTAELQSMNEKLREEVQERRRAEEALTASQRFARNIIDSSLDMIIAFDSDRRIIEFNRAAEKTLGYSRDQVIGQAAALVFAEEKASEAVLDRATAAGGYVSEVLKKRRDGGTFHCLLSASVLRDAEGSPIGYMGVSRDISKQKALEEQLLQSQKMESIGLLAGGIAHDINNVLTPIVMAIDLLRSKLTDEEGAELVEMISSSAKRGTGIVKQILTIARRVEGEQSEVQTGRLLKEISKIAMETFPKSITVRVDIPSDLLPVLGDSNQLHQVLLNLAVNARDAMPAGGTLVFRATSLEIDEHYAAHHIDALPGRYTVLEVSDTGRGIPKHVLPRIFEAFFTTKEPGKGTGLGLSTVHAIVRSHGGFIVVGQNEPQGTSFKIYLPAIVPARSGDATSVQEHLPPGNGEGILVVDDESSVREVTRRTLAHHGYLPFVSSDGSEAVALFASKRAAIRLVVTDLSMPVMDGFTTIRALRRIDPHLLVIATSGRIDLKNDLEAENLTISGFLEKPFTANQLLSAIQSVLSAESAGGNGVRPHTPAASVVN